MSSSCPVSLWRASWSRRLLLALERAERRRGKPFPCPAVSARPAASWPPAQPRGIEPAMNELATAPANAGFMSINDALVHVERCRSEGRLSEAEALCRHPA